MGVRRRLSLLNRKWNVFANSKVFQNDTMSIKLLAKELYLQQKQVEHLEKQLASLPYDARAAIEHKLRKAKAERDYLQRALNGRIGR